MFDERARVLERMEDFFLQRQSTVRGALQEGRRSAKFRCVVQI